MKPDLNQYLRFVLVLLLVVPFYLFGQEETITQRFIPIHTAVPSLTIAPDARGGGLGDNGIATSPDINAQYWNPAKYSFHSERSGISLSYTPWLRKLVNDMALIYVAGYYQPGKNKDQAVSASVRYFSMGEIPEVTFQSGTQYLSVYPYEMAVDLAYSRKLSPLFSMAVAFRYIRSDMGIKGYEMLNAGNAFAVDVAGYLEKAIETAYKKNIWSVGFSIANLGSKISYDGGTNQQFLPAMLRVGTGFLYPFDEENRIGIYFDLNKYLVPGLPIYMEEEEEYQRQKEKYNSMSSLSGVFKSFSDAPGGFSEELKEIMFSLGLEYGYKEQFFVRGGYYHESQYKGNRRYCSLGAGFRYKAFYIDIAYLISTVVGNPLDQTLRLSLSANIEKIKNMFQ